MKILHFICFTKQLSISGIVSMSFQFKEFTNKSIRLYYSARYFHFDENPQICSQSRKKEYNL